MRHLSVFLTILTLVVALCSCGGTDNFREQEKENKANLLTMLTSNFYDGLNEFDEKKLLDLCHFTNEQGKLNFLEFLNSMFPKMKKDMNFQDFPGEFFEFSEVLNVTFDDDNATGTVIYTENSIDEKYQWHDTEKELMTHYTYSKGGWYIDPIKTYNLTTAKPVEPAKDSTPTDDDDEIIE